MCFAKTEGPAAGVCGVGGGTFLVAGLLEAQARDASAGEGKVGVRNERRNNGATRIEERAAVVRVFGKMPVSEFQLADAGANRAVRRVARGPQEPTVI